MQWHKKTVFPRNSSIPDILLYFCFLRKQMDVEKRYQKKWFCWMDGFRKRFLFATMSHFSISRCFLKFMIADFWDFWRENSNYTVAKWDFFDSLFLKGLKMDPDEAPKQKACYAICLMLTFALGRWACSLEVCSCVEWAWPAWGLTPLRLVEALRTCYATAHVALPIISGLTGNWKREKWIL